MGWGEPHPRSVGTTREIEIAHEALDALGIETGPLAVRTVIAANRLAERTEKPIPAISIQVHDAPTEPAGSFGMGVAAGYEEGRRGRR